MGDSIGPLRIHRGPKFEFSWKFCCELFFKGLAVEKYDITSFSQFLDLFHNWHLNIQIQYKICPRLLPYLHKVAYSNIHFRSFNENMAILGYFPTNYSILLLYLPEPSAVEMEPRLSRVFLNSSNCLPSGRMFSLRNWWKNSLGWAVLKSFAMLQIAMLSFLKMIEEY